MADQDGTQPQADVTLSTEPAETPKSYSQEQLEKAVRDAKAAALADVGRMQAEANKALKAAQAAQERLAAMSREREEAELAAAKDEPDKVAAIRARQQARKYESDLEKANAELNEARTKLAEHNAQQTEAQKHKTAQEIASKHGVDAATLAKLAKSTDGSTDSIEDIAKLLPKVQTDTPTLKPDSNRTRGGAPLNKYQIMQQFNSGQISNEQYAEKMKAMGLRP